MPRKATICPHNKKLSQCPTCTKAREQKYYQKNRETIIAKVQKWVSENYTRRQEYDRMYSKNNRARRNKNNLKYQKTSPRFKEYNRLLQNRRRASGTLT